MSEDKECRELDPCPFCGGDAQITAGHGGFEGRVQVECSLCRIGTFYYEKVVAVRQWNRRAAKPAVPERRFPMQRGPSIPWSLAELIYVGYAAQFGRQQSLERLAERNGFSWREVEVIYGDPIGRRAIDAALSAAPTPPDTAKVPT